MGQVILRSARSAEVKIGGRIRLLSFIFGLFFICIPAFSQLNYGRIFGVLTDQTGGAIAGAMVTVTDVQRGVSRTLTTDSAGAYNAPNLIPGQYSIRAEYAGFRTVERQDIQVQVGQELRIDLSMQPGEQNQLVTVTGEAPELNTSNAQLGGTLENETVLELPMNGRQYTQLLNYRPGMQGKPGVGPLGYSSNGNRNNYQVFMFDGLFSTNLYSGASPIIGGAGGGGGLDESTILPLDAIQEINIIENPKAEYGWLPGGQVNVGLKSGTNRIHGSAYAFGRDTALEARNPYVTVKPTTILEQYGATIGGPIKKDKLFFFGAFEANQYDVGVGKVIQEPAELPGAGPANSFPDAIAAVKAEGVGLSQLSLNLAGCTAAGACNAANGIFPNPTASPNVQSTEDIAGGSNNGLEKIDYHLNDHNALNFEYFFGNGSSLSPGSQSGTSAIQSYWRLYLHARASVFRGVWVFAPNSTWVNEARFGYDNTSLPAYVGECEKNLGSPNYSAQFGFVSGAPQSCGFPGLTISGFSELGGIGTPTTAHWGNTAFSDAVSYTRGKHLFKFGFEIHNVLWGGGVITNAKGTVNFGTVNAFAGIAGAPTATALEDYLAGDVSTAAGNLLLGSPVRQLSFKQYATYAQDDWAITRRFTVNLGLRYEYNRPITESDNLIANFNASAPTGMVQETSNQPVFNGDHDEFGPRLGIAWDVTGKGTTVIRAGGSILYTYNSLLTYVAGTSGSQLNAIPTGFTLKNTTGNTITSPGTIQVGQVALAPSGINWTINQPIYNSTPSALACGNGVSPNPSPCNIFAVDPNYRQGYVSTWTLAVQHAFTNNLSLTVAYVGTHGTKLSGDVNANAPIPGLTTGEQQRRPYYSQFPYFGAIEIDSAVAMSNYNGLQVTFVERATRNLSFTVGYTYSHDLDEATADGTEPMNITRQDYGNSTNNATHHATIAAVYMLPGVKAPAQLLQGWQLSATVNLLTGFAWNPLDSSDDISGTGSNPGTAGSYIDRWTLVGNAKDFDSFGAATTVPCWGVAGSTFAKATNCSTVTSAANMPAACVSAAGAEPNGPGGTTGSASLTKLGCYVTGNSVIVPPAQGTFGTMPHNDLRTQPFRAWDLSITKNTKLKEWLNMEFRTEVFNVFNSTQYTSPNANLAAPASFGLSPSSPNSSNSLIGSGGPRTIEFGLKFIY